MRRRLPAPAWVLSALLILAVHAAGAAHHEAAEAGEAAPGGSDAPEAWGEDRQPWDQERMTELSARLATQASEVRRAFRREPNFRSPRTPNQRAVQRMEQILRSLETATGRLQRQVGIGGGYEGTRGVARRIGMLLNDADVEGRSIMTSAFMAERIQPAMETINEIAPFYGRGPIFDPATMQRLDRPPNPQRQGAPAEGTPPESGEAE